MQKQKLNRKLLLAAILSLVVVGLAFIPSVASASPMVKMKQVIRPLPCGVDHITDVDGTEHYFAPKECPKVIMPKASSSSQKPSSNYALISGPKSIYIETKGHTTGDTAYVLITEKGEQYKFRLAGDSLLTSLRTLEVLQATTSNVTLLFAPSDKQVILQNAARLNADIAFDSAADINIRIRSIEPDGKVVMLIWFPVAQNTVDGASDTKHSLVALLIIIGVLALVGYLHAYNRWYKVAKKQKDLFWRAM